MSGRAAQYDIRYATVYLTAQQWTVANQCENEPVPGIAGYRESYTIEGLRPSTTYYIAMKAADEVPNWSAMSNVLSVTTSAEVTLSAGFRGDPRTGTIPLEVNFTDSSTGDPAAWQWDFGDGTTSTQQHPSHIYQDTGTFSVQLVVSNAAGADTLTREAYIKVQDSTSVSPVAAFTASPVTGAAPLTVHFTDSSTGSINTWRWNFGDGNTSTEVNPSHVYSDSGTYTVSLIVDNGSDTDTLIRPDLINVSDTSTVVDSVVGDFVLTPDSGTAPLTVQFQDLSTGDVTSWQWDFGDGTTSNQQHPTHTYNDSGVYIVSLVVSNGSYADSVVATSPITVTSPPDPVVAGFSAIPLDGFAPLDVTFADQSQGNITSWHWDFGDGVTSTSSSPMHTYIDTGKFTVRLVVSDGLTTDTAVMSNYISVADSTTVQEGQSVYPSTSLSLGGTESGDLAKLLYSDNDYLRLTESESNGRPDSRHSYLEYVFSFDLPQAQTLVFRAEANRPANPDGDDFAFQYSQDDVNYTTIATVSSTFDSTYAANVLVTTPARIYVKVVDTDHTPGRRSLDDILIDQMYIEVDGTPLPPDTIYVRDVTVSQDGGPGNKFRARADVRIYNHRDNPVGGALVKGHFDGPSKASVEGYTDSEGHVVFYSEKVRFPEGSWYFTVDDVSADGMVYGPQLNYTVSGQAKVTAVPITFELYQNYPNPFNPSTTIGLWMPESGHLRLRIYNAVGRLVTTLYDGPIEAGSEDFQWDASDAPSGVYFFRATVNDVSVTRRATLLK